MRDLVSSACLLGTVLAAILALSSFAVADPPATDPQTQPSVVTETDHLAFMQPDPAATAEEPSSGGLLIKTLGAMLLVVGLIFFAAWGLKKLGFGGPRAVNNSDDVELSVLSTVTMGSGRSIATIRFGERLLLIGSTSETFTLLAEDLGTSRDLVPRARSVAEMLADEPTSFDDELKRAEGLAGLNWTTRGI